MADQIKIEIIFDLIFKSVDYRNMINYVLNRIFRVIFIALIDV